MALHPPTSPSRTSPGWYSEDFDAPARSAAVPPPEPAPILAEAIEDVRAQAYAEGFAKGAAQEAAGRYALLGSLCASLIDQLREADPLLRRCVDEAAERVTRLMFSILAATFPTLCRRHGGGEVARFTADVIGHIAHATHIAIRIHPTMQPDIDGVLAVLDPALRERITIEPLEAIAPGDARIRWPDASAVRDAQASWEAINRTMLAHGLADPLAADATLASAAAWPPPTPHSTNQQGHHDA